MQRQVSKNQHILHCKCIQHANLWMEKPSYTSYGGDTVVCADYVMMMTTNCVYFSPFVYDSKICFVQGMYFWFVLESNLATRLQRHESLTA